MSALMFTFSFLKSCFAQIVLVPYETVPSKGYIYVPYLPQKIRSSNGANFVTCLYLKGAY